MVIKSEINKIRLPTSETSDENLGGNWGLLTTLLSKQPVLCITDTRVRLKSRF